jgi:hypothetical protein
VGLAMTMMDYKHPKTQAVCRDPWTNKIILLIILGTKIWQCPKKQHLNIWSFCSQHGLRKSIQIEAGIVGAWLCWLMLAQLYRNVMSGPKDALSEPVNNETFSYIKHV